MIRICFTNKMAVFLFLLPVMGLFPLLLNLNANAAQINQPPTETLVFANEVNSRKEILSDALKASRDELNELKNKIISVHVDNDKWQEIKLKILNQADDALNYYNMVEASLNNEPDLETVKSLAKELKMWRENVFSEYLKKSINFILVLEEGSLLKIADTRLDKIASDLNRLEKQSVPKSNFLRQLFNESQNHLRLSHDLNNGARKLLLSYFDSLSSSSTATTIYEQQKANGEEIQTSASKKIPPTNIQDTIRDMVQESLKELKATYEIFVKMSKSL